MTARIGIIGGGSIVRDVHLPTLLAMPDAAVAWVADQSSDARRRCRHRFSVPTIAADDVPSHLDQIDAVLLATPLGARARHLEAVAAADKPLYLEKPAAGSPSDLDLLVGTLTGPVIVGFQRREFASVSALRDSCDGRFGDVRRVLVREGARVGATGVGADFRDTATLSGGGILVDLGCHSLDVVDRLVGLSGSVVAEASVLMDDRIDRDVRARLVTVGGVEIDIELSWLRSIGTSLTVQLDGATVTIPAAPAAGAIVTDQTGAQSWLEGSGAATLSAAIAARWRHLLSMASYELGECRPTLEVIESIYAVASA